MTISQIYSSINYTTITEDKKTNTATSKDTFSLDSTNQTNNATQSTNTQSSKNLLPTTTNKPTSYGFNTDEDGFFGADFNKAAGIPEYVKINIETLNQLDKYATATKSNLSAIETLSKAWQACKAVAGDSLNPNGDGLLTVDDIKKMPMSYCAKGGFADGVVSVQNDIRTSVLTSTSSINLTIVSSGALNNGFNAFIGWESGKDNISEMKGFELNGVNYDKDEPSDKVSLSKLFATFVWTHTNPESSPQQAEGAKNYYNLAQSGQDIKSYAEKTTSKNNLNAFYKSYASVDGKYFPNLVDDLFAQLNSELKQSALDLQSNQYAGIFDKNNQTQQSSINNTSYSNNLSLAALANKIKIASSTNGSVA